MTCPRCRGAYRIRLDSRTYTYCLCAYGASKQGGREQKPITVGGA